MKTPNTKHQNPNFIVARKYSVRSDDLGLLQCLGVLATAATTALFTAFAWHEGHRVAALAGLVAHGNVCSLFISAVHELSHGTVFESRQLNRIFQTVFGFLNWMDCRDYFKAHGAHHTHTLQPDDPELPGACRKLWVGTWVWSAVFNFPKCVVSLFTCAWWIYALHVLGLFAAVAAGIGAEWFILVSLAPFWFGWLELAVNYPQHAGLPLNGSPMEITRSLRLPGWLSFLHWRMEYHLEHHLWPGVPCYRLPAVRRELEKQLPPRETLWRAWRFILTHRRPGLCGGGVKTTNIEHPITNE